MKAKRKESIIANTLICNPVFDQMKKGACEKIVDYIVSTIKKFMHTLFVMKEDKTIKKILPC